MFIFVKCNAICSIESSDSRGLRRKLFRRVSLGTLHSEPYRGTICFTYVHAGEDDSS